MKAIVSIDEDFGIGKDGNLLIHNKEDMKFFKETTMGHPVIMGMKTYKSLPCLLKGRENIIITKQHIKIDGAIVCNDYKELLDKEDAFVIGGSQIYALLLPYCNELYITENKGYYGADVFFPRFDKSLYSREVLQVGETYEIVKYTKL